MPAVVQHLTDGAFSTGKAITVAATGAGNLLVAVITTDNLTTDTVTSITDGTSNFAQVPSARATNSSGQTTDVWWLASSNGGKTAITIAFNATTSWACEVFEVSGISSPAVDSKGVVNNGTASGTDASGASVTPSSSVAFGVGGIAANNSSVSVNPKAGNEFSSGGDISSVMNGAACSLLTTTATAHQPVWTLSVSGQTFASSAVFFKSTGGPSTLTLYASNPIQGGSNAGLLALSAPTASTSTTGWTVGTTIATQYSRGTYNTEVPTANFTATAQPSGAPVNLGEDCFRISAQTSGVFSAGTWYSTVSVIAVTSGGIQDGQAQFRYWRSLNADGTSATEITQGIMVGSRITELSTTVAQSSSASTQVSTQTFNNEYLFLQLGWETL